VIGLSLLYRRDVPIIIASVTTIVGLLAFFFAVQQISDVSDALSGWAVIISGFFLIFGFADLTLHHGRNIAKQGENWIYSIWLVGLMWGVFLLSIVLGRGSKMVSNLYTLTYSRAYTAQRGLLGFWITSATYRSFKIRSLEGALLMIAGFFVILGNIPASGPIWIGFPYIRQWLLDILYSGGIRPMIMTTGFAMLAYGMRVILGWERTYLGAE
jgi:hypothetical protein